MKDALPANTMISHYRILSPLGAGGMSEVYLAEDTRLPRRVALKLLAAEFTKDDDRVRRFEQEARAVSALNHPNILTILEVGSERGTRFIATEFVEGETLRQRLRRGSLSTREALDVAMQVASALEAAHRVGIIHRDIKPENVMLRPDGYVKVLDFGIAKLTERFVEHHSGATDTAHLDNLVQTESNIVMGSPSYMSPEQARGLSVDARTDIFSLGVMMYEMVAGKRPFEGETAGDVLVAILDRRPEPLAERAPDIPPMFETIIYKALAKSRDGRYQSVGKLLKDLRRLKRRIDYEAGPDDSITPDAFVEKTVPIEHRADSYATVQEAAAQHSQLETRRGTTSAAYVITEIKHHKKAVFVGLGVLIIAVVVILFFARGDRQSGPINSIAVLPFANESADPNSEYLSDGLTESLINNLSQSRRLKVMARNSVFQYKGKDVSAQEVGRALDVRAVLTGRITQRGDDLQIRMQLVDARDGSIVWGEQYSRRMADLLVVQEEIAKQVSDNLQLRLSGDDQKRMAKRQTADTEAFRLYLKGRFYWNKRTEDGLHKGIDYFKQAIERDPTYALAYAGLADCYAMLTEYGSAPTGETYPKVKAAAERALEIDDTLAEAHTSLGAAYEYEWKWAEAEQQYRRAIELNPNYATAHHWYAVFLGARMRHDEALREMKLAWELDPLSLIINTSMGRLFYGARQYDRAIEQLRKTLELDGNFAETHFHLAMVYEAKRMYGEAIAEFQKAIELFQDRTMVVWVGRVNALSGKRKEAERILGEVNEMARSQYISPYPLATVYAAMGDKDRAFEYLEKVYTERSYYVVWLNVDPTLDGLRADPRFQDLLRRIGIAP
jgi:serine/threonine protein kinase/tetratricopeptide (TPR) repeat protein